MNKGFTLVEVLVAVIILSIGILAVSQMTVMGMRTTVVINQRLYARTVMAQVFEDLNARPANDALLDDYDGPGDLDIADTTTGAADYKTIVTNPHTNIPYTAVWNIANNTPEAGIKSVRIHILWGPPVGVTLKNKITTNLLVRM